MTPRFEEALAFTARCHAGHTRKGSDMPYIAHLLAVCALVIEAGGDEDAAIAALLHDAVEDQKATLEEIRLRFGEQVATVVDQCSDTDEEPKPPWRARKEKFIAGIADATPSAQMVMAADKLHNVRSISADHEINGDAVWERFNGGRDGSLWYYRAVCEALTRAPERLHIALRRAVADLERAAGASR